MDTVVIERLVDQELQENYIGTKFFVRDNHDDPIKVGVLRGYHKHENSGCHMPIMEINGQECLCFSALLPWSFELEYVMKSMTVNEQWEFMKHIKSFHVLNERKCGV